MQKPDWEYLGRSKKDFYKFVNEHDRRRGTDFLKTFPEYELFYNECKKTYEEDKNRSLISKIN